MHKYAPLVALSMAAFYMFRAASNMPNPIADEPAAPNKPAAAAPQAAAPAPKNELPNEPVHKSMIRCLTDLDDLLDTIHDPASFAAAKPKLLARARQQAALAAEHPNQGLTRLSRSAGAELQKAINRHAESLTRAMQAVPNVREFIEKDLAAALKAK